MELEDKQKAPIAATEPPPTYDEASHDKTPLSSESPPSYDQLFGVGRMRQQMKEARDTSSNKGTFAVKFCDIVCSSVLCMICLIILAALPVAMIVIGCVYINRCQGQPIIPIWLIVFGCVGVLQTAINIIKRFFKNNNNHTDEERNYVYTTWNCFETCLSFFLLIWIILGSYWVFGYYTEWLACNELSNPSYCYCHPVPYWFSYVTLVVIYVTSCIFCFVFCFAFIVIAFAAAAAD